MRISKHPYLVRKILMIHVGCVVQFLLPTAFMKMDARITLGWCMWIRACLSFFFSFMFEYNDETDRLTLFSLFFNIILIFTILHYY